MGATYTRQSSSAIVDGGVIEAADINAEFNQVLAAFAVTSGHTHDGTAAEGGPITKLLGTAITIGDATAGTDIAVTFDGQSADGVLTWMEDEDYFQFSDDLLLTTTERLQFRDTALYIHSSADGQLDIIADTEVQIAATTVDINGAVDISGALTLAGTTLAEVISDTTGAMFSSNTETGITVTYQDADNTIDLALSAAQTTITSLLAADIKIGEDNETKIDFETANEIHLYAANAEQVYVADGIFGPQTDSDVDLGTTGVRWKNAFIDSVTTTGNITIGGDLTVTGDDITMGTNTAGNLLIADGTNFNSVAVSSLTEISTAASGDLLLAVDASGGGLKKIARSTVVAGLATDSAIANIVEDTSPQLGGNLDTNSQNILIDDAHFIADESGNEQIIFQTTGSAVNQFDVTNAASGAGPRLSATGGDSNIDLDILAKGTGHVTVRGNTTSGTIQFNCESNSHGQIIRAQPHSASATNIMLLPEGADSTLVSLVSTDTLTNKTLTSPKINENVAVTSTASELNALDGITAVVGELNALDIGSTAVGTAVASKAVILDSNKDYTGLRNFTVSGELDAATGDFSGNVDVDGTLEADAITINGTAIASVLSPVAGGSSIVTTGALGSGSIAAGFGAIDNGTSGIRSNTITAETAFVPDASGGADLGTTALEFNDAFFNDGAVINFGNDQDTTLTHTDGTGLTLNSTNKLCFNDATQFIQGVSGTVLDIAATDEIELTATLIDVVGNLAASGTLAQAGVATFALAANVAQVAITSSSNAVAWDASAAANAYHITTENTTFSAPSNNVEGAFIVLEINYNGSHTIAFNTIFEFAASTAPTTTDTDGKTDILVFRFNGAVWQEVGRTLNLSES